jgi:hypothetical protein
MPVLTCPLNTNGPQGIHVLIGRDVLAGGMLIFNGRAGTLSLAF